MTKRVKDELFANEISVMFLPEQPVALRQKQCKYCQEDTAPVASSHATESDLFANELDCFWEQNQTYFS